MSHRCLVFAELQLETPLHIGCGIGDNPFSDQPVLRDLRNIPFIPGNALAGALIENLAEMQKWARPHADGNPLPSPLVIDDAYPLLTQTEALRWPVEVRNQVTQMRDSQTAKTDQYFKPEFIPRGAIFCFSCRGDFSNDDCQNEFILQLKDFFASGGSLGGKQNAGIGEWKLRNSKLAHVPLDLSKVEDLKDWLKHWHGYQWRGDWESLSKARKVAIDDKVTTTRQRDVWKLTFDVEIKGLHMSAGSKGIPLKGEPDISQAERLSIDENGDFRFEFIDYGTAVKGRLRTAMEMLLRTYLSRYGKMPPGRACEMVPIDPTARFEGEGGKIWCEVWDFFGHAKRKGGWKVREDPWRGSAKLSAGEDHIKLDEFTQHVMGTAKYEFSPLIRGTTKGEVEIPGNSRGWQKALIYYAARLLACNILPWGGHGSRGYLGACLGNVQVSKEIMENDRDDLIGMVKRAAQE